jgi:hypothetical protein
MTRDQIRESIIALRRAQDLQDSVPASQFLADLTAEILEQDMRKEAAA